MEVRLFLQSQLIRGAGGSLSPHSAAQKFVWSPFPGQKERPWKLSWELTLPRPLGWDPALTGVCLQSSAATATPGHCSNSAVSELWAGSQRPWPWPLAAAVPDVDSRGLSKASMGQPRHQHRPAAGATSEGWCGPGHPKRALVLGTKGQQVPALQAAFPFLFFSSLLPAPCLPRPPRLGMSPGLPGQASIRPLSCTLTHMIPPLLPPWSPAERTPSMPGCCVALSCPPQPCLCVENQKGEVKTPCPGWGSPEGTLRSTGQPLPPRCPVLGHGLLWSPCHLFPDAGPAPSCPGPGTGCCQTLHSSPGKICSLPPYTHSDHVLRDTSSPIGVDLVTATLWFLVTPNIHIQRLAISCQSLWWLTQS